MGPENSLDKDKALKSLDKLFVITRGEKGSIIISSDTSRCSNLNDNFLLL